ncbi:33 kDa inner dynein arm light chain, axonemal-like [Convolutriloba macropyga]|uniref:33 kDa inner dynein arm light chain, axonemal-like n=1 Tax=Convolutriloba macropyga TaxID=536237 RepID=UPI003F525F4E
MDVSSQTSSISGVFLKYSPPKQVKESHRHHTASVKRAASGHLHHHGPGPSEKTVDEEFTTCVRSGESVTIFGDKSIVNRTGGPDISHANPTKRQSVKLDQLTRDQIARQVLNEVFPPKVIRGQDGTMYTQEVCNTVAPTGQDIEVLEWGIEEELQAQGVRFRGVDDKRYHIYQQVFEELVRQEICAMPERGQLLARVKQESDFAVDTYRKLFPSGVRNSARKEIICNHLTTQTEERLNQLQEEKEEMLTELNNLKNTIETQERKQAEFNAHEDKRRADEIAYWKRTNQMLEHNVKDIKTQWLEIVRIRQSEQYKQQVEDRKHRLEMMKEKMKQKHKEGEELQRQQEEHEQKEKKERGEKDSATGSTLTGSNENGENGSRKPQEQRKEFGENSERKDDNERQTNQS